MKPRRQFLRRKWLAAHKAQRVKARSDAAEAQKKLATVAPYVNLNTETSTTK